MSSRAQSCPVSPPPTQAILVPSHKRKVDVLLVTSKHPYLSPSFLPSPRDIFHFFQMPSEISSKGNNVSQGSKLIIQLKSKLG